MNWDFEAALGVKLVSLVWAFIASLLGLSVTTPGTITPRVAFTAVIGGLLCGSFAPEAMVFFFNGGKPLPMVINNGVAVIFGLGGMFIITGIVFVWKEFAVNPWGVVDRFRGIKKSIDEEKKP